MLKDITVQTVEIKIAGGQSFHVQGVTLTGIGGLLTDYREPLEALMENKLNLQEIADHYPDFMAKIVAIAANEPDQWDKVKELPFPTQLLAFEKCWDLTIPDYDALKKLIERIKGLIPKSPGRKARSTKLKSK
jgi:DNA-binding transcriptional regulator PaaX